MSRKPYAFQRENNDSRSQTVSNVWRDGICIYSQEVFVLPKWFSDIQEEDMRETISWFSDQERFESIGSMARVVFTVGKKHHLQVFISDLHSFEFLSLFFSHWKTILWQSCKKSIFFFFFWPLPMLKLLKMRRKRRAWSESFENYCVECIRFNQKPIENTRHRPINFTMQGSRPQVK